MGTLARTLLSLIALSTVFIHGTAAQVDLTSANRRPPIPGLPDWSGAGFEGGSRPLPTDADVKTTITADQVKNTYGIIPDDGQDDTDAFQKMIGSVNSVTGNYVLIQLPAGVINLSHSIYIDKSYLIIRGASNDPDTGTRLVFSPDENTKYDKLTNDGSRWDLEAMEFKWEYSDPTRPGGCGPGSGCGLVRGTATSGWIWPGRSIFRIESQRIASKFQTPYDMAPANRKDFFLGSINYHWSIDDGKVKGYQALQTLEKPGVMGTNRVYVDNSTDFELYDLATDVWIGSPVKANDYRAWGVQHDEYFVNSYVFQDWFTVTHRGTDETGNYLELDHDLRFDVYASSVADGSEEMEDTVTYGKVMPILDKITNVGIENLYMTQPMPGMDPQQAVHNYGNLAPESAMHGIVFRFAQNCWVRNIRTFMTGSHPIATEDAKNIQIQDNLFDGAWNKGAGGNGYLRGSRVWDSIYFNNTLRNLRHITMQWSSMGNVVILNNITNDMNLHGGYEAYNLFELNYVSIPYEHRAGACQSNCGGEGGSTEGGTWFPIYWSTGDKASKWSGASGPQNVFYRNYMLKAMTPGAAQTEYRPYWARDGSLSDTIWQFGWDRDTPQGDHYQHLTQGPLRGNGVLLDWQGHEQDDFANLPGNGVNGLRHDKYTSLFLRDVSGAGGISSFDSIAGFAYCRGKVQPKAVGYYVGSSETGNCLQTDPDSIDSSAYTHVLYAYASVAADGTVTISDTQKQQIQKIKGLGDGLKVYLAVGGYGLGADPTPMQKAAVNSGGARTKLANSLASVCSANGIDGVDLEWATGVTAAQFTTIASTVKTALGSRGVSLSVPSDFWSLSGVNKVTTTLRETVDFISLWTHASAPGSSLTYPHSVTAISDVVQTAQKAGMFPDLLLMPVGFYGRSYKLSGSSCDGEGCGVSGPGSTSQCISSGGFQQNTYPYYALDSILVGGNYDGEDKKGDTWVDTDEYYRVLQLSDGSIVEFDVPASITNKVGSAIDLCMGGVSVFSIDQDTYTATLETAIWDVGGMAPSAEDIALSVSGSAIGDDGDVDDSYWDAATTMLSVNYPWLPAVSVYRVLVFIALRAQQQISARLRNYLQFSDFTTDNFGLYQKWETKAIDWALANITGYGRQYWTCSSTEGGTYTANDCPHVFEQNNKDQAFPNVYWKLADHDGFRKLVNDTFGLDIDTLIVDKIDVAMADVYCLNTGTLTKREHNETTDEAMDGARTPDKIKELESETVPSAHAKRQSQLHGPSPYDPDPDCKSTWHGVYQANGTALFTNPADTLTTWIDAYETSATTMYAWNSRQDVIPTTLSSLLESILTNIVIGSGSIQSTQQYIDQVRFDKELQKEFDAFKAQQSGLQMFLDIGLSLLSLIPGIGDGALIASAVVKVVNVVGDAIKVARITRVVEEASAVTRALEAGVTTEREAAGIGRAVDGLLDSKTLETRGKIGKNFEKNNNVMRQCLQEGVQILMDASDLAQAFFLPDGPAVAKREEEWEPSIAPHENIPHGLDELLSMDHLFSESEPHPPVNASVPITLERRVRAKKDPPCVWTIKNADDLKGYSYEKHCRASTNKMKWNIARDGSSDTWLETTYAECKDMDPPPHPLFDKGMCACDHILEALEVVSAMIPSWLEGDANKSRREALCAEFPNLTDDIRKALNSADNMEGLWGLSNTIKSSMLDGRRLQDVAHVEISALTDVERSQELEIAIDHTEGYADRRKRVAQAIDAVITAADNPNASADWKKLYSAGMMDAERGLADARFSDKLEKAAEALVNPTTGDPDVHNNKKRKAKGSTNASCKKKKP